MNSVLAEPNRIPNSNDINRVPDPIPLRWTGDKLAIHANNVGLFIPVATPKTIDAAVYENTSVA